MIFQLMVQGSPQHRPAIMLSMSPVTKCSAPSSAWAVRNRQSARSGSTMAVTGRSSPHTEVKKPSAAPAKLPTPAWRNRWVGLSAPCSSSCWRVSAAKVV